MASGTPDIVIPDGLEPSHARFRCQRNPIRFHSEWSQRDNVYRRFERWNIVYRWDDLTRDDFDALFTLFDGYGSDTPFTIHNAVRPLPTGSANVAALAVLKVAGGTQTGKSVAVDGGPNSTLIFRRGDFIGIEGRLYRVKANCTTNGSGAASIQLCQYLITPADNADVIVSYAPVRVLLNEDPEDSVEPSEFHSFEVQMTETFIP